VYKVLLFAMGMSEQPEFNTESLRRAYLRAVVMGLAATGAAGLGSLTYARVVEPAWIEVREVSLALPRLPAEFDGYRVVQMSDLHVEWMGRKRLMEAVALANSQRADLIAITGDFVTQAYERAVVDLAPLGLLRAKDGVVAVLGNHDYWGWLGPGAVREAIREIGLIDLNNRVHTLERDGALFHVAGVDSARAVQARLDKVLASLPREGGAMLLAHEPDFADRSAPTGRFDLQISGHSHGGQVVIPFVGPPHLPPLGRKYHTGLYKVRGMLQYTNRGLGTVGIPVRFWCRPELTVFTLRSARIQ
jgi:predicted MPP superfamily phosphohydrolase